MTKKRERKPDPPTELAEVSGGARPNKQYKTR